MTFQSQCSRRTHRTQQNLLYSHIWFIAAKTYRLKSTQGSGTWVRVQESPAYGASSCLCSMKSLSTFPAMTCDSMPRTLPTSETHLSPYVQGLLGGIVMQTWWAAHVADLSLQALLSHMTKALIINHTMGLSGVAYKPQISKDKINKDKIFIRQDIQEHKRVPPRSEGQTCLFCGQG